MGMKPGLLHIGKNIGWVPLRTMLRSSGCISLRIGESVGPCEHNDEPPVWGKWGSQGGVYEDSSLFWDVLSFQLVNTKPMFWKSTIPHLHGRQSEKKIPRLFDSSAFWLYKMREVSWISENLSEFQELLCFMELVIWNVLYLWMRKWFESKSCKLSKF